MRVEVAGRPRKTVCTKLFANANSNDWLSDDNLETFMASIESDQLVTV